MVPGQSKVVKYNMLATPNPEMRIFSESYDSDNHGPSFWVRVTLKPYTLNPKLMITDSITERKGEVPNMIL